MRILYSLIVATILISCSPREIVLDKNIPAGNIVFERMSNDTIYLHQELRGSKQAWFYWAFRVKGAQGRNLTFVFTKSNCVSARGPVVSLDRGKSYEYLAEEGATKRSFTYTFPTDAREVWFYECHPYTPEMWSAFLSKQRSVQFETGVLCQSPKKRDVPFFRITPQHSAPLLSVVVSARHHCSEASAEYVVEGLTATFLENSELGVWLRNHVELIVVPFVDMDGAVDGDQGKWRLPHDHNRDYTEFRYPETAALAGLIAEIQPEIFLDIHNPGLRHFQVYTPYRENMTPMEPIFSALMEKYQEGGLNYSASDDLPFGVSWNTAKNYTDGKSSALWVSENIKSIQISRTIEIPFTHANGALVYPSNMREFGHGLARTLKAYVEEAADMVQQ